MRIKTLLFLLLIFTACSKTAAPKNCLRLSFNERPTTTDPRKAGDFSSSTVVCMTYEGLTRCLPGGEIELALAQSVTVSEDEKTYTFHLRKAEWSDGAPITAHDFAASWKQILSPPGVCAALFYPIKNAEKCVRGEVLLSDVGIYAVDDFTLKVELEHPTPYFYSLTAFPSFFAAPAHTDDPFVCSGPFQQIASEQPSEISLLKNKRFWNTQAIFLDEIHISIVPDEITALQMFERGELDWIGGSLSPLPLDALDKLKDQLLFVPNAATTFCTFNTQVFPFNNLSLRKALSYAIDRVEIAEQVTQTGQHPADSFLPPPLAQQYETLSDPAKARSSFAKALQELHMTATDLDLVLYYKTSQIEKRLAQTLQRHWQTVLGINVKLVQLDAKSLASRLQHRDYQLCLTSWIAQFDDPISILDRFKDKANLKNYPGWENSRYTALLNKSANSTNRDELLSEAEKIFMEEAPLAPIYHWRTPVLASSRIVATGTTPCGGILFERFRLAAPVDEGVRIKLPLAKKK